MMSEYLSKDGPPEGSQSVSSISSSNCRSSLRQDSNTTSDETVVQEKIVKKCPQSLSQLRTIVTIEVVLFLYVFGGALVRPTVQALVYRKVCLEKYNVTVCDNLDLSENKHQEDEVQTDASHWYLAENLCFEIPSILLSSFYGSLSDNMSRKAALLLPGIGQILSTINYVVNSVYMDMPVAYILIGPIVSGIFGGWVSCGMASFAYLSDVTTSETRTTRIAIAESIISVSAAISAFIGGKMLDSTSFHFVTSVALCLYILMFLYTIFWIREPPSNTRVGSTNCGVIWRRVCAPEKIKAALGCVLKKRERNRRAHILVGLSVLISGSVGIYAEFSLAYLFVRRQPLNWSQTLYGYFSGYGAILSTISQLLILPVLRNKLHMRDTSIIILAFLSMAFSMVLFAFSTHTWMVFLVPLVSIFGALYWVILRSMLSKMVEKEELGRLFAVFGAIQSLNGLISSLLFNNLYPVTLHFWNGFCFILGATVCSVPIALVTWLGRNLKKYGWETYSNLAEDKEIRSDTFNILGHMTYSTMDDNADSLGPSVIHLSAHPDTETVA